MWARWSKTIGDRTRSRIGLISLILAAGTLIWICHPSSFTRLDGGSIISGRCSTNASLGQIVGRLCRQQGRAADLCRFDSHRTGLCQSRPRAARLGPRLAASRCAGTKPDDAVLFDLLLEWAPDEALRHRILVENAAILYDYPKSV